MPIETSKSNKDIANSLNRYSDTINKSNNIILDGANKINEWYSNQIDKISENNVPESRLETNVDNSVESDENEEQISSKIETKVEEYNEIQTSQKSNENTIKNDSKIKTQSDNNDLETIQNISNNNTNKTSKRISTVIKGTKIVNNATNKIVKIGKSINTGLNDGELKSFENNSSRIMTRPIKVIGNKVINKATNKIGKESKKFVKKNGKKIAEKTISGVRKASKLIIELVENTVQLILSMLPSFAPIIIIILIIAALGNFLNLKDIKEADNINFEEVSKFMIEIDDPNLQAIYNEFLKNIRKPYLMDHTNLSYDTCMETYDCSSFVIHCLAHTGIKVIPDTTASGLYADYCNPVEVNDRKPGDLIFLKDTYDTGTPGGISHVGIYMGQLTINGDTAEWIIDTGGNPEGVKIGKYQNGWWNGSNFYGFGRLK